MLNKVSICLVCIFVLLLFPPFLDVSKTPVIRCHTLYEPDLVRSDFLSSV